MRKIIAILIVALFATNFLELTAQEINFSNLEGKEEKTQSISIFILL